MEYFPVVADKLDGINFKDLDKLCGDTYYSE